MMVLDQQKARGHLFQSMGNKILRFVANSSKVQILMKCKRTGLPSGSPLSSQCSLPSTYYFFFQTQTKSITTEFQKRESISKEKNILLYKRLQESLELSQGLATMKAMDSLQWEKVALENLEQGGSLQVELKPPVFLEGKLWPQLWFLVCFGPFYK